MNTPRMKSAAPDRTQHFVVIVVDGVVDEVMVANSDEADALAETIVVAAMALGTVRVPVGGFSSGGFVVVGNIVMDLGKARRTEVRVETRSMQFASMGIKK